MAERLSSQDLLIEMLDGVEQKGRVGQFGKRAVEVLALRNPSPKLMPTVFGLELARLHAKQAPDALIEIGEHAIGVEEESRLLIRH
jgi:hypothetical protein